MKLYSDRIVLKDRFVEGYLEIKEDIIQSVHIGQKPETDYIDCTGKIVMPGLINIQNDDFIQEEYSPYFSPFPKRKAFSQIERLNVFSGVTTIYHCINMNRFLEEHSEHEALEELQFLKDVERKNHLIDHCVHLKFQLGNVQHIDFIWELLNRNLVDMITYVSQNGQERYRYEYFFQYIKDKFQISDSFTWSILNRIEKQRGQIKLEELSLRLKYVYGAKIPVATTDYRISRDIQTRYRMNIPIILDSFEKEALDYIQQNDKHATIDINNLWDLEQITNYSAGITRRSYSVVTANKKVENLLESIFIMAEEIGLVEAVRMGTYNPAQALNLTQKGEIAEGKTADLIVVEEQDHIPVNVMTISSGQIILNMNLKK
ncbi:amidohydrolase family protein [Filifactor alocis]